MWLSSGSDAPGADLMGCMYYARQQTLPIVVPLPVARRSVKHAIPSGFLEEICLVAVRTPICLVGKSIPQILSLWPSIRDTLALLPSLVGIGACRKPPSKPPSTAIAGYKPCSAGSLRLLPSPFSFLEEILCGVVGTGGFVS